MYQNSSDILTTSRMMGHKKIQTTTKNYVKYDTRMAETAAKLLPEYGKSKSA